MEHAVDFDVLGSQRRGRCALFDEVANAGALRDQLIAGSLPCEVALIDGSAVLSRRHLEYGAAHACRKATRGAAAPVHRSNDLLRTRNVHSELIYALSPLTKVSEALKTCGASEATRRLCVVALDAEAADFAAVANAVRGTPVPLDATLRGADRGPLARLFQLDPTAPETDLEDAVLMRLALKDCN